MKKIFTLLSTVAVTMLLIGCGAGEDNQTSFINPHQLENFADKLSREFDPDSDKYREFMKTYYLNSLVFDTTNSIEFDTILEKYSDRDGEKHYGIYYDIDRDVNTGYYEKWIPDMGAEYLYEDGRFYKYSGADGSHEWSWVRDDDNIQNLTSKLTNARTYAVEMESDWHFGQFLGYCHRAEDKKKKTFTKNGKVIDISNTSTNLYLHTYYQDRSEIDNGETYFNYTFKTGDKEYHTEGNILYDSDGNEIGNNLQYEVRDNYSITIIPKSLFGFKRHIMLKYLVIRDDSWRKIASIDFPPPSVRELIELKGYNLLRIGSYVSSEDKRFIAFESSGMNSGLLVWDRDKNRIKNLIKYGSRSPNYARREGVVVDEIIGNILKYHREPYTHHYHNGGRVVHYQGYYAEYDFLTDETNIISYYD